MANSLGEVAAGAKRIIRCEQEDWDVMELIIVIGLLVIGAFYCLLWIGLFVWWLCLRLSRIGVGFIIGQE